MIHELKILVVAAASIGFFHTLLGPDHYLPFIVMGRAGKWSPLRTGIITLLCGLGHVAGSVVLGLIGIAFGIAIGTLEITESYRGSLAAWLLIGFGLAYSVWGLRKAFSARPHTHHHAHAPESEHTHEHVHAGAHVHLHTEPSSKMKPWVLFTIFVLGPCEPLIPILMYPAAKNSMAALVIVTAVFATVTIATMMSIVLLSSKGLAVLPMARLERYSHAIAGAVILLSGISIQFLGL